LKALIHDAYTLLTLIPPVRKYRKNLLSDEIPIKDGIAHALWMFAVAELKRPESGMIQSVYADVCL